MADGFDGGAIGGKAERAMAIGVMLRAQARRSVVAAACGHGGGREGGNLGAGAGAGAGAGGNADMAAGAGGALGHPEQRSVAVLARNHGATGSFLANFRRHCAVESQESRVATGRRRADAFAGDTNVVGHAAASGGTGIFQRVR